MASSPSLSSQGQSPLIPVNPITLSQTSRSLLSPQVAVFEAKSIEFRKEIESILSLFDTSLVRQKNELLHERESYTKTLSENAEKTEKFKSLYQQLLEQKTQLLQTLQKEKNEVEEAENNIKDLSAQHEKMLSHQQDLEKKLSELTGKIKKEKDIQHQKEKIRQIQLEKEIPELEFFKRILALDVEAIKKDLMKFIYANIDSDDWSREFSVTVDVSSTNYQVTECEPPLDSLDLLVSDLNRHRDFYLFLKRIRQEFVKYVKNEKL